MEKVVVITGASAGIGAALAGQLGKAGHRLVLAARRREELSRPPVRREERSPFPPTLPGARRSSASATGRSTNSATSTSGSTTPAAASRKPVLELTDADFDEMMTVNVKSALYGMQAVVPHFMARGAGQSSTSRRSSAACRWPHPLRLQRAKAALNALTANLRNDLAAEYPDIHVSLVMPGLVKTGFAQNALGSSAAPAAPSARPPAGMMQPQTAEEVAAAIAGLIAQPEAEIYTNPASPELVRRYYADVGAFEAQILGKAL